MRLKPGKDGWAVLAALGFTVGLWACFTWPLPAELGRAIPASHDGGGVPAVRETIPGDHLQLLYHFTLAQDMMTGRIPWMHNVYEFNLEGDDSRKEPGTYYAPFSLVFALLAGVTGPAAAWNLAGLLGLLLTAWLTYLLARRYTPYRAAAWLAAAVAVLWPYRWINVLGGSPTGFAMAWVPLLGLGIDSAVRRGRWTGGCWAALALLFAGMGDTHTFFFGVLSLPLWCALAVLAAWPRRSAWLEMAYRAVLALIPVVFAVLLAYLLTRISNPSMGGAGDRNISEVALFAPQAIGFFDARVTGPSAQILVGRVMAIVLGASLLVALLPGGEGVTSRIRRWTALLLALTLVGMAVLALGPYGPLEGRFWVAARKLVPPYTMIRQTAKIFCLFPTLAALLASFGLSALAGRFGTRVALVLAAVVAAAGWVSYAPAFSPALCGLPGGQGAYRAVAQDARQHEVEPRVLAVTLWPGDAHYTSVYLYFAQQAGLRLVNGYRPYPPAGYVDEVFQPWERINQGVADDPLLDDLLRHGIGYLLVHEDLFPEKVSPFPVGLTLERLESRARLTRLAWDGPVRAYRIEASAGENRALPPRALFPAWRWRMDRQPRSESCLLVAGKEGQRPYAVFDEAEDVLHPRTGRAFALPDLRMLLRVRGEGTLSGRLRVDDHKDRTVEMPVHDPDWHWLSVPVQPVYQVVNGFSELRFGEGHVELDRIVLASGAPPRLEPGESLAWPASWFFHAGYSEPQGNEVFLRPPYDAVGAIFYGPHWPMEPGTYRVSLDLTAEGEPGLAVGTLTAGSTDDPERLTRVVRIGEPAVLDDLELDNRLLRIQFIYHRTAPVTLQQVRLTRIR